MTIAASQRQIVGLDLLRFSAAFMVVMFHLGFWIWAGPPTSTPLRAAGVTVEFRELSVFAFGRVGVEIFFVLSGFIIAYSAERASAYRFFRSRIVRLAPAVWIIAPVTLAAAYLVRFAPRDELTSRFLRTLLFSPIGPYVDGVYWTLGIEVAFYSLVFLLLLVDRFRWLPTIVAVIGLTSSVYWVAIAWGPPRAMRWGPPTLYERCLEISLVDHGCLFALGVFLWLSLLKKPTLLRFGLMACFASGALASIWFWSKPLSAMSDGALNPFVPSGVWIASVAGLIFSVKQNYLLQDNMRLSGAARVLGLMTYPLYLLHDLVGAAAFGWLFRMGADKYWALLGVLAAIMALALAIAVQLEPRLQAGLRVCVDRIIGKLVGRFSEFE